MCAVSMVGDYYKEKWGKLPIQQPWIAPYPDTYPYPQQTQPFPSGPSQKVFDDLKKEVQEMHELLRRAKLYDEQTGQPDCEMEDKVALLKKIAEMVGIDLSDVFGKK